MDANASATTATPQKEPALASQQEADSPKGWNKITAKLEARRARRAEEERIAAEAAKLPRTAGRSDLHPMELGQVWELGDQIRLQRVYLPHEESPRAAD